MCEQKSFCCGCATLQQSAKIIGIFMLIVAVSLAITDGTAYFMFYTGSKSSKGYEIYLGFAIFFYLATSYHNYKFFFFDENNRAKTLDTYTIFSVFFSLFAIIDACFYYKTNSFILTGIFAFFGLLNFSFLIIACILNGRIKESPSADVEASLNQQQGNQSRARLENESPLFGVNLNVSRPENSYSPMKTQ